MSLSATNLHLCADESSFQTRCKEAGSQVIVVHFEAEWAEECLQMNEVMNVLANELKHSTFIKVPAEELPELSQRYGVELVPTFVLLKAGKVICKLEGADATNLTKTVRHYSTSFVAPVVLPNSAENVTDDQLKQLLTQSPCMLFMKGEPETPKCGFSKQIVEILREHGVEYKHFDILTNNAVRQGLKRYSDWPTYPQLYANGELIGGLDIVKDLAESGTLKESLPSPETLNERLWKLVRRSDVMIFMKGHPDTPRCKFSKALMALLQPLHLHFDSFDILQDDDVRQGLKSFSDWPTFPQVYVKGEFIGGLDIIKELHESGELASTLRS